MIAQRKIKGKLLQVLQQDLKCFNNLLKLKKIFTEVYTTPSISKYKGSDCQHSLEQRLPSEL